MLPDSVRTQKALESKQHVIALISILLPADAIFAWLQLITLTLNFHWQLHMVIVILEFHSWKMFCSQEFEASKGEELYSMYKTI